MAIFGYMNLLILSKWIAYDASESGCAPSILIALINMFLMKYPDEPCSVAPFYAGQKGIQTILVLTALVCVPWMLCIKPYILKKEHDQAKYFANTVNQVNSEIRNENYGGEHTVSMEQNSTAEASGAHGDAHVAEFDLGEVIIHQAIHTIEYCLGSISHTASYLRLWALSLAHAQLSEVLWNMVMRIGLQGEKIWGGVSMYIIFAIWATLTVVILLLMEGLSAFLHALRLHWVEFQSKFYSGTGYLFQPFSFEEILNAEDDA